MADEILLVLSTFPDLETARRITRDLIDKKCAACANILPSIESIYRWQGKVEEGNETLVFFKTSASQFEELQKMLLQLHPYETPEVIALSVEAGLPAYLQWVTENAAG
ncbi:MAG TPA: divalent-cation tolerance protein CutA [Chthoniobacterales bacterium]|jgi:periplasmic divalent cation tolerance protein